MGVLVATGMLMRPSMHLRTRIACAERALVNVLLSWEWLESNPRRRRARGESVSDAGECEGGLESSGRARMGETPRAVRRLLRFLLRPPWVCWSVVCSCRGMLRVVALAGKPGLRTRELCCVSIGQREEPCNALRDRPQLDCAMICRRGCHSRSRRCLYGGGSAPKGTDSESW